jgi:hypothetical protein
MIELMRLKCEAYSTLNDSDEDALAENKIQERLQSQGMEPPKSIVVAPAALYLTAILECICEHILSSVGRVATRDSSKEVAGTHDLFVALCEDDGIYSTFKVSKVYGLIENSLKLSSKPRRSKSLSRSERYETRDTSLPDPPSQSRVSSESTTSGVVTGSVSPEHHPPRSSIDKGKAIKSFRPSSDRDMSLPSDPPFRVTLSKKSLAAQRDSKDSAAVEAEEGNSIQDFDDLMRSGDTMRVSLTPDRLRSMEAAKQQQRRTTTQQTPKTIVNDHHRGSSTSEADSLSPDPKHHPPIKSLLPHVDSIIEDEEPKETAILTQDVRTRSEVAQPPDVRARSVSTSKIYQGSGPRVTRKSSLGIKSARSQSGLPGRDMYDWRNNPSATPQRTRRIQRNRESMDIGDVLNGSEEGDESNLDPDQTTQGRGRLYPVSKATNDLISFLEDGPPPEIQPVRSATLSTISLAPTTKSAKSGNRLQRMISKLNLSKEDRFQDSSRSRGIGVVTSAPSTISSLRYLGPSNPPPVPIAMKPVPPPIPQLVPISPPSSSRTSSVEDDTRSHTSRTERPRRMSLRKAVPTWGSTVDQGHQTPHAGSGKILPTPPASACSPSPSQPHGHAQVPPTPVPEGKDTNGVTDNHKDLQSESPATTPSPTLTGTETHPYPLTRENGSGRAEQQNPQGMHRPRSSRPSLRSPTNDEQTYPARRPMGSRARPPNGTVDHSHPSPSLSGSRIRYEKAVVASHHC